MSSAAQLDSLGFTPARIIDDRAVGTNKHYHLVEISDNAQAHLGDVYKYDIHHHHVQINVVGTVGTIATIVNIATRSITTLAGIRNRHKDASMMVNLLTTQLVSVKTALDQIRMLIEESLYYDQHYQLVMNLDIAIKGCHLLLEVLDGHISILQPDGSDKGNFKNRVKLTLESNSVEQCLSLLDRQLLALNTIITAYSARSLSRQKELMEGKRSQQIFDQVKDDTTSLHVLCDSASFVTHKTRTTTTTSKLSWNFDFDARLLQHRVYKAAFRSLVRRPKNRRKVIVPNIDPHQNLGYRNDNGHTSPCCDRDEDHVIDHGSRHRTSSPTRTLLIDKSTRSDEIERNLNEISKRLEIQITALLIEENAEDLLRGFRVSEDDGIQRRLCRQAVESALLSAISRLPTLFTTKDDGDAVHPTYINHVKEALACKSLTAGPDHDLNSDLQESFLSCTKYILSSLLYHDTASSTDKYFLNNAHRMFEPGYSPDAQDAVKASGIISKMEKDTITLTPLNLSDAKLLVKDSRENESPSKGIEFCAEYFANIIYVFDLTNYVDLTEFSSDGRMRDSIALFDSIVNNEHLVGKRILLVFYKFSAFGNKISKYPLSDYFPEYTGSQDVYEASEYILQQFTRVNRQKLHSCGCFCDLLSPREVEEIVMAAVGNITGGSHFYSSDILEYDGAHKLSE